MKSIFSKNRIVANLSIFVLITYIIGFIIGAVTKTELKETTIIILLVNILIELYNIKAKLNKNQL